MQPMTAREYMRELLRRSARIDALHERQRHYIALAERMTASYSGMPGGRRQASRVEEYACKAADLARELDRRIDEYVDLVREAERLISRLPDERYRDVLTYRYLNGWRFPRVARAMGYERKYIYRLHEQALHALDEIVGKK